MLACTQHALLLQYNIEPLETTLLDSVCSDVVFQDLVEFTREHGVDLTSHGDERDILPADRLASSLAGCLGDSVDPQQWRVGWVARYSSVIHLRGIIAHKG